MSQKNNLSLSVVKNVKSISELSVHDDLLRRHAKSLVVKYFGNTNPELHNDIINDMYIKLYDKLDVKGGVIEKGSYISSIINNACRDIYSDNNRYSSNEDSEGNCIFDKIISESTDLEKEELFNKLKTKIDYLNWYEKEVLLLSLEYDMKELSRISGVSYKALTTTLNRALAIIKKI